MVDQKILLKITMGKKKEQRKKKAFRRAILTSDFYSNDWVFRQVMSNIDKHEERMGLELSSRRLLNISRQCPCFIGRDLRVYVTFYEENSDKNCKVVVEKKKGSYYQEIKSLSFKRSREAVGPTLTMIGERYYPEISRVTVHDCADAEMLQIINDYFKRTTELYCYGFTNDAMEYLNNCNHDLGRRITKLGLMDFILPSQHDDDCLLPFQALTKLSCTLRCGFPMMSLVSNLHQMHKLNVISIRHSNLFQKREGSDECPDFSLLSEYCYDLKVCDRSNLNSSIRNCLFQIDNLTHLEVWLCTFTAKEAIQFFLNVPIYKLKSASINRLFYNDEIIDAICSTHTTHSRLAELRLDGWCSNNLTRRMLLSICPRSLEKLYIKQCTIETDDISTVVRNCPFLREFQCDPGAELPTIRSMEEVLRQRHPATGCDLGIALLHLKKLDYFKTRVRMEPGFLSLLCNDVPNIRKAQFPIHKLDKEKAVSMLRMFYNRVRITKNPYVLEFEDSDLERDAELRANQQHARRVPANFPFDNLEICETWHVSVSDPVKQRPPKRTCFEDCYSTYKFCYCERISNIL